MLSPYRVLDLTNERGLLCGQILGDLGADVIKIEPPGGSSARHHEPYYKDEPDPNRSLYWWAYNRNKRSVTLDLESDEGRGIFRRLLPGAHFLIESFDPGYMASLGLDYASLEEANPGLIYISITPFGQDGPKAGWADTDLIVWAAGGPLALTGDSDRPPVRVSVPQAYLHASAEAAVAALIAHHERARSGRGQHIDVAAQQSVDQATLSNALSAPLGVPDVSRNSGGSKYGPIIVRGVYPASDGFVAISFFFGTALGPMTKRLMDYIYEQGFCDETIRDKDWIAYVELLLSGKEPESEYTRVRDAVEAFTSSKTKAELMEAALERSLLIAPIVSVDDVLANEQLAAREYWQPLEHPELGVSITYPGAFTKFSETPLRHRLRPPLIGEHNRDVYVDELGMTHDELAGLVASGVV